MKPIFDNAEKTRITRSAAESVQPKLSVSEPGDPYEEEADRMADAVMRKEEDEEEPVQMMRQPEDEKEEPVQLMRQPEYEEEPILTMRAEPSSWVQRQAETPMPGGPATTPATGTETSSGSGSNEFSRLVANILRGQLSNSTLRGYLSSLGTTLESLAEESTRSTGDEPAEAGTRLTALRVSEAFETTARAILADPALALLRREIVSAVRENPALALALVLCGGTIAGLADVGLRGSPRIDLGSGFNLGITFDLGTIQSPEFNNLATALTYTAGQFSTSLGGGVSTGEEDQVIGTGTAEVRVGGETNFVRGSLLFNTEGELVFRGRLSTGVGFGGSDRLVFSADVSHTMSTGVTTFSPGVTGRFALGAGQSLSLGTSLDWSSSTGTRATGFVEYGTDILNLRAEFNTTGIPASSSIYPGGSLGGMITLSISY